MKIFISPEIINCINSQEGSPEPLKTDNKEINKNYDLIIDWVKAWDESNEKIIEELRNYFFEIKIEPSITNRTVFQNIDLLLKEQMNEVNFNYLLEIFPEFVGKFEVYSNEAHLRINSKLSLTQDEQFQYNHIVKCFNFKDFYQKLSYFNQDINKVSIELIPIIE